MKLFRFKRLIVVLILLTLGFYLFLTYPYFSSLIRYYSLSGSGLVYTLKGKELKKGSTVIRPVSTQFGLVITKLGLNKNVTKEVDFYNPVKLDSALDHGLAHINTSSLPGRFGAVLIVGHPLYSSFNFAHFNPEFYLISKLEEKDEITVFYNFREFIYRVTTKKLVSPTYLDFFEPGERKELILVSGYPPGMAFCFLVIEAEPVE